MQKSESARLASARAHIESCHAQHRERLSKAASDAESEHSRLKRRFEEGHRSLQDVRDRMSAEADVDLARRALEEHDAHLCALRADPTTEGKLSELAKARVESDRAILREKIKAELPEFTRLETELAAVVGRILEACAAQNDAVATVGRLSAELGFEPPTGPDEAGQPFYERHARDVVRRLLADRPGCGEYAPAEKRTINQWLSW